jgi:two-component system cell cycle sensor histidine kinase/response regulator CckA
VPEPTDVPLSSIERDGERATPALTGAQEILADIAANVPGMVYQFRIDAEGSWSFPFVSDGVVDLYGFTADEVRADASVLINAVHPEDRETLIENVEVSRRDLTPYQIVHRIVARDGGIRWLEARSTPRRLPDGSTLWNGIGVDITRRKDSECELEAANARHEMLTEAANVGFWEWSFGDGSVRVSDRWLAQVGLPPDSEFLDIAQWRERVHPDDRERVQSEIDHAISRKLQFHRSEYRMLHEDGTYRWMLSQGSVRVDPSGSVVGLGGAHLDVTEQREAQEVVDGFFDQNLNLHIIARFDGEIVRVNRGWATILGYAPEELEGTNFLDLVHPDDVSSTMSEMVKLSRGQIVFEFENRYRSRSGDYRNLLWSSTASIERHLIFAVAGDVTERRAAERALRDSEERHRLLLECAGVGIGYYDLEGTCRLMNRVACDTMGAEPEEVNGRTATELFGEEIGARMAERSAEAVASGEYRRYVDEVTFKGRASWFESTYAAIPDASGEIAGVQIISENITDRIQAEQRLKELQAELHQAQKMDSVGRLAGGVAHDFNNMLAVILGRTEVAKASIEPTNPLALSLDEIEKAALRSADLTRQLLAFARRQTIAPREMDLNDDVHGMIELIGRLIGEAIEMTWHPSPQPAVVRMDPSQLHQVLVNLCVNARDAMPQGGRLEIGVDAVDAEADGIPAAVKAAAGSWVRIWVRDSGCGMDEETTAQVFEPFFTTKPVGEGTGLGLSTVYGIVKQNHGEIEVSSALEKGTTFRVYLPAVGGTHLQRFDQGQGRPSRGGGEHILLVEDEPAVLDLTRTLLEELGYRVTGVRFPREAIGILEAPDPDVELLLTDMVMPGMNGRDLAAAARRRLPGCRVVFMSGYASDVVPQEGLSDASPAFLQKPFSLAQLADVIDRQFGR